MNDDLFKVGDTLYHWKYGKMTVLYVASQIKHVRCGVNSQEINFPCYDELSFTPYDLVSGGFSQVRPTPNIEKGQLIWVKDSSDHLYWQLLPFEHFVNSFSTAVVAGGSYWDLYSITNPYDPKLPCFQI
jgi:hypothetical protein